MKKVLSYFRPEEAIGVFYLFLLGFLNVALQVEYRRPYSILFAAYGEAYFFPVGSLLLLSVVVWRKKVGRLNPVRDWLPFILCLLTYEMLHDFVHWINPHDQDASLAAMDYWIFGVQPSVWLERFINPRLTDYLSFTYLMYFVFPPGLGFILYFRKNITAFRDAMLAVVLTCFIGYIGYLLVPAVGPEYFQRGLFSRDLKGGPIGEAILLSVEALKPIPRDCFPSLHTAVTTVVLIFAYRHSKIFFWTILPFALSLFFSTLYLRYHYFVDLLAGWALATLCAYLGVRLNRWWYENVKAVV